MKNVTGFRGVCQQGPTFTPSFSSLEIHTDSFRWTHPLPPTYFSLGQFTALAHELSPNKSLVFISRHVNTTALKNTVPRSVSN